MKDITYNDNIRPKHSTNICHVATTKQLRPGGNHFNAQKKCFDLDNFPIILDAGKICRNMDYVKPLGK